jgi:hypothetical protein
MKPLKYTKNDHIGYAVLVGYLAVLVVIKIIVE